MTSLHFQIDARLKTLGQDLRAISPERLGVTAVLGFLVLGLIAFAKIGDQAQVQLTQAKLNEKATAFLEGEDHQGPYLDVKLTDIDLEAFKHDAAQQHCLAEAVYYEARSQSVAGQRAVAEVVMNRVASRTYPNTVCGVVYQGTAEADMAGRLDCQFSFTCDDSMDRAPRGRAWDRAKGVAMLSLTGAYEPMTNRATHYHTTAVSPYWAPKLAKLKQVGDHRFYRFKRRTSARPRTAAPPS